MTLFTEIPRSSTWHLDKPAKRAELLTRSVHGPNNLEVSQNEGYLFGGPHNNKDYSILGSTLRFPYLGKLPFLFDKLTNML